MDFLIITFGWTKDEVEDPRNVFRNGQVLLAWRWSRTLTLVKVPCIFSQHGKNGPYSDILPIQDNGKIELYIIKSMYNRGYSS